jgi:acetyl-CoA C-acetyltransferase
MKDVAVVSYCRTGIAKATRGALNQTHGIAMAAHVLKEAVKRAKIDAGEVEDVILGCGSPRQAQGSDRCLHRWRYGDGGVSRALTSQP